LGGMCGKNMSSFASVVVSFFPPFFLGLRVNPNIFSKQPFELFFFQI
jgi:hypothetical protein